MKSARQAIKIRTTSPDHFNAETGGEITVDLEEDFDGDTHCVVESHPHGWDFGTRIGKCEKHAIGKLTCTLPPMPDVDGLVHFSVGRGHYYGEKSDAIEVEYVTPLAASFASIPYYDASSGELLVRTQLHGAWKNKKSMQIRATSQSWPGGVILEHQAVHGKSFRRFIVNFQGIREDVSEDVTVQLLDDGKTLVKRSVRLVRVPHKKRGRVAVDAKRRSLEVDGRPFFPISWFASLEHGVETAIFNLQEMARRGVNAVMMYNLVPPYSRAKFQRGEPVQRLVLDACATLGIKVHVYLLDLADRLASGEVKEGTPEYDALGDAVKGLKDHPAVLSWYVADDDSGEHLPSVYKYIKRIDPYHPVSIAVSMPRDQNKHKYVMGADIIMTETYPADGDAAYKIMQISNHWPTMFMPSITCGRAWTIEEDGYVISRPVFRSQFYHALIGGATGETWFRFHEAKGWNNPGVPLLDESGQLAREVLELVPSLINAGNWHPETAMPPVIAHARYQNGTEAPAGEAMRAKAFREVSGLVTLLVANGRNEPMQAVVNFAFGSPGIYDKSTGSSCTEAMVPFELSAWHPRRVKVCGGQLEEWLPAWGVQVFRFNGTSQLATEPVPSYPYKLKGLMTYSNLLTTHNGEKNLIVNPSFETSSTFVAAPDGWFCGMADAPKGRPDSSCFADTSVSRSGRHSGRFVTGANPFLFRMRPSTWMNSDHYTGTLSRGNYAGSVWAQADRPMDLEVVRLTATTPGDTQTPEEEFLSRVAIGDQWTELAFELLVDSQHLEMSAGLQLAFKASMPGVVWLDDAELMKL